MTNEILGNLPYLELKAMAEYEVKDQTWETLRKEFCDESGPPVAG